jgi:transcriptional regulator with XRE-family HTH domain
MTQADVAKELRRPQSFVSKYESGERNLDVIEFLSVCRVVGVAPANVLDKI